MAQSIEKRQLQDLNQQLQQPMVVSTVAQPMTAPLQPNIFAQPQPVIIQIRKPPPRRYDNYEGVRSRALGITHIICAILAIIINAVGIGLNDRAASQIREWVYADDIDGHKKGYGSYNWYYSRGFYGSCGFWCAPLFIICGSFAIFAAKRPTKCPVITCLVLAILSSVFGVTMFAMATWAVADDAKRLEKGFMYDHYTYIYRNRTYNQGVPNPDPIQRFHPVAAAWANKVIVVSLLFLCVSIAELVSSIWIAVIAGKVLSTDDPQDSGGAQVQYISNTQAPGQIIILDRHGRPIPDAQVIQVPGPSNIQSGGNMAPVLIAPQGQVAVPATQPIQVAPPTQHSDQVVTPSVQLINVQPPAYTPADGGQQHSKSGENSPPPPY